MKTSDIVVRVATQADEQYAIEITDEIALSAQLRGSGISKRSPASIIKKMREGKAIIATTKSGQWVGFSYIETWSKEEFVSNSGLIVSPAFRGMGVAKSIKERIVQLSQEKYPNAKIFSITTGMAIMKMNHQLGFEPVTFSEITPEKKFWLGCKSCINYQVLKDHHCKNCLCTAMLRQPGTSPGKKMHTNKTAMHA